MRKAALVALAGILLMAPLAFAQMAEQPDQSGATTMNPDGAGRDMALVTGKITTVDLSQGTLTLDNGTEISLPQTFQYTSAPAVGEQVEVLFVEQGGHKEARSIDLDTGGRSSHDSN
jgi:hypothetical protein